MPKTSYQISLKGYVGGLDFDRSTVDKELAKNEGKQVNVLIDSLCNEQKKTIEERDATIAELQAKLAAKPAASTTAVVEDGKPGGDEPKTSVKVPPEPEFLNEYE